MIDPQKRSELEQSRAMLGEVVPAVLAELRSKLCEHFNEAEAWELTRIACFAMMGGKCYLQP